MRPIEIQLWKVVSEFSSRSDRLATLFHEAGIILYVIRRLIYTCIRDLAKIPPGSIDPAGLAAGIAMSTLFKEDSLRRPLRHLLADLLTPSLVAGGAFEQRPELMLLAFAKDHADTDSSRIWNPKARNDLLTFLNAETTDLEAKTRGVGPDRWDGRSSCWDAKRIRILHPVQAVFKEGSRK